MMMMMMMNRIPIASFLHVEKEAEVIHHRLKHAHKF